MPPPGPDVRHVGVGQGDPGGGDRQVDVEHPPPAQVGGQHSAQGGPADRGQPDHGGEDAERHAHPLTRRCLPGWALFCPWGMPPDLMARIPLEQHLDDDHGLGRQRGRADALQHPGGDQLARDLRRPAQRGGHREQGQAGGEQPPRPEHVAEPAGQDQQRGEHQQVGVDHPERLVQRRVQIGDHARQGHVDDRAVQQDRECSQAQHDQGDPGSSGVLHRCAFQLVASADSRSQEIVGLVKRLTLIG